MADPSVWMGLMSGTSVDGIDAVAISCTPATRPHLLSCVSHPWPQKLQQRLREIPGEGAIRLDEWLLLDNQVADEHVRAIKLLQGELGADATAIGFHGQTLFHQPPNGGDGNTLQLGNPARLAAGTGLPVIADFRRADMALGGQGAPLAPAFHQVLFAKEAEGTAVLNLGGIANLSLFPAGRDPLGFDTGPANALMDHWCQLQLGLDFDEGGRHARQGQLDSDLLMRLLGDPYFARKPPKSTGREYFSAQWLQAGLKGDEAELDVLRTLLELTISTITQALQGYPIARLILVGGGSQNTFLRERLAAELPHCTLPSSDGLGWPENSIEAGLMAWLAMRHWHGLSGNIPSVTGARSPAVLGAHYPAGLSQP